MATLPKTRVKLQNEELKDAYRVWLKDLYDDKPEQLLRKLDKKKRLNGGMRAKRELRAQQAQKHTASSALKDVAVERAERPKLPPLSTAQTKQVVENAQRRRWQALVGEANYAAVQYTSLSWRPGLAFFQRLVYQTLKKELSDTNEPGIVSTELADFPVNIAPTLLRMPIRCRSSDGSKNGVALLFCQDQNQDQRAGSDSSLMAVFVLHVRVYLRAATWRDHRQALLQIVSNTSAEVCAVTKSIADPECRHNNLRLLHSQQEVNQTLDIFEATSFDNSAGENELMAIQKYIPFKGAATSVSCLDAKTNPLNATGRKAWITRCAFRKKDKFSSTVWIISSGGGDSCNGNLVTNSKSGDCQLVKCTMDQAWSKPRLLTSTSALALERALRVRFHELVIDMLQDISGNWWLLQVKSFSLISTRPASAATTSSFSMSSQMNLTGLSRTQSAPTRIEATAFPTTHWKKWRCAGRYCTWNSNEKFSDPTNQQSNDDDDNDNEPSGYLTKKVLRSCEFFNDFVHRQDMSLAGGFTEFPAALSFHLQHRLPKRDRSQLYESQPLCCSCLRRYHALRQQWIETVESKTPSNLETRKKTLQSKAFGDGDDQVLPIPRKLPSLNYEAGSASSLNASSSAPALAHPNFAQKMKNTKKLNEEEILPEKSTYLDELTAMEEMLAEHEPPSITNKTKKASHSSSTKSKSPVASTLSFSGLPSRPKDHDFFPNWDGETRIEAMWQSLGMKPLEKQLTGPGESLDVNLSTKESYNSISLHKHLEKLAVSNDDESDQPIPIASIDFPPSILEKTHTIQVRHCRKIFEDEMYREELVSDAVKALQSGNSNVHLAVAPPDRKQSDEQLEIAEVALRSLYLDVKQALPASTNVSSWPMRPTVCREASGYVTVKLGL